MKIRVATIYLHDGKLVASRTCGAVVRVRLPKKQRLELLWQAKIKAERLRIAKCRTYYQPQKAEDVWDVRCNNVASGLRIRVRLFASNRLRIDRKHRTKVPCATIADRCLAEADKVRAANTNKVRNADRWLMKCISINRNMKTRCGVGKHECASAKELRKMLEEQEFRCAYTGEELREDTDNARVDHKIPVALGGKSTKENLHWVTAKVNAAKGQMTHDEFVDMCRKVVEYADWQLCLGATAPTACGGQRTGS